MRVRRDAGENGIFPDGEREQADGDCDCEVMQTPSTSPHGLTEYKRVTAGVLYAVLTRIWPSPDLFQCGPVPAVVKPNLGTNLNEPKLA